MEQHGPTVDDITSLDANTLTPVVSDEDNNNSTLVLYALIFGVIYALYNGYVPNPFKGSQRSSFSNNRNYRPLGDGENLHNSDPESDDDDPSARKQMMEMSSFSGGRRSDP